ncbi:hypothetical protein [Flavisolibacter ginsenosidimutans]|uniref:DUF4468 domain-containing protein n=1 Tax=Flavisolibacter ginsenosidimutans TaxID=661481 RepID=A0A5B8UNP4_9BACT|nr:hypothetical protein [Flavisolibacter ginsenosidimutans]QEC58002.1 hypothetical protein FSB75_19520 [Flavisolibacter ginsenosidimutans]
MKLFLLLCSITLSHPAPLSLLVLDMNGKKPPRPATEFSMEQYLSRHFPIYTSDLKAVIDASVKAAKFIDQKPACNAVDTVRAAHTVLIVRTDCSHVKSITVRYVTKIDDPKFLCDFELIKNEEDFRKAQVKLLDFVTYLSQE